MTLSPLVFPILAAVDVAEADTFQKIVSGMTTSFALICFVIFALQSVAFWITSKLIAEGDGSFLKGFKTLLGHTAFWILSAVLFFILKPDTGFALLIVITALNFALNISVAVKVHDFGVTRGFAFTVMANLLSALIYYTVFTTTGTEGPMKRLVTIAFTTKVTGVEKAEERRLSPEPKFATQKDAQAAAVKKFPELGMAGSPFNKAFLEKHAKLKSDGAPILSTPGWPMKLAEEVASEIAGGSAAK